MRMIKKTIRLTAKLLAEIFLAIFICLIFAAIAFAAVLSRGAVDMARALPFIKDSINAQMQDNSIDIGALYLEWQGFENPVGLRADDVVVRNDRGPFLYSPEVDVDISARSLLLGRVRIQDLWIRKVALSVTRTSEGNINITGHALPAGNNPAKENPASAVPAVITLNSLIYDLPRLDTLRIDGAKIIYRDEIAQDTRIFDPATIFVAMNNRRGIRTLSGFFSLPFGTNEKENIVRMNFTTKTDPLALHISARLKETPIDNFLQFAPALPAGWDIDMTVDADIRLELNNLWQIGRLDLALTSPNGHLHFPNDGEIRDITLSDVNARMGTDKETDTLHIETMDMVLNNTGKVSVKGRLSDISTWRKAAGDISVSINRLPREWFPRYWPASAKDNGAYEWLVEKMSGEGSFSDLTLDASFDMDATTRDDGLPLPPQLKSVKAAFSYDGLAIDYNPPMVPSNNVSGTGAYDNLSLALNIESADIGNLKVSDATLYFDDLITEGSGNASLYFPIKGSVSAVFDYISKEPINALEKMSFDPSGAKGNADLVARIDFPTVKDTPIEEFSVVVTGILTDVILPGAVRDLTLSGKSLAIEATTDDVKIKGDGKLQGKDIAFDWHEYFSAKKDAGYLSKITAKLAADDSIRKQFLGQTASYFKGNTDVGLTYIAEKNGIDSKIDLSLDLTDTALEVATLGLDKSAGQNAKATLSVGLKNGDLASIDNLVISGRALSMTRGDITFDTVGGEPLVRNGALKNIKHGENRFSVNMASEGGVLKINLTGPFFDVRPILTGKKDAQAQETSDTTRPMEIGVDVLEMRTADEATITNVIAYALHNAKGQMDKFELDAQAGRGKLYVRYAPESENGLSLQVESNDAGDTLRAFDLYPSIQGGHLRIAGRPLAGGSFGDVRGKARIDNFVASDAPALVRLLNALSFQGAGSGLNFKRLEADFEWRLGDDGDLYVIENGTTSGASIGLTFDGTVDTAKDEMNIRGTAAPLSGLNNIVGNIPIIGDILTGGGGALVAATYSLQGRTEDPQISVNPLSVLTPGILRKMLFEGTSTQTGGTTDEQPKERSALN